MSEECMSEHVDSVVTDEDDEILPVEAEASSSLSWKVDPGQSGRLDKFVCASLPEATVSREKVKKAIKEGCCTVDGLVCTDPNAKVVAGQWVILNLQTEASTLVPVQLGLKYIYKDSDLAVVEKPVGLTVHPCPSCEETTLVHGLLWDFPSLAGMDGVRPGIVHRLDKDTSGIMLIALNETARLRLSDAFAERAVHKSYLAIVCGIAPQTGICREPIGRHPTQKVRMAVSSSGRPAHTEWKRLFADPNGQFSVLEVTIHTGRTHQIRVHLSHLGFPLVGDKLYRNNRWASVQRAAPRQMLHAWKLRFVHPVLQTEVAFVSPLPEDMVQVLLRLSRPMLRVVLTGCPGCGKSTVLKRLAEQGVPVVSADVLVSALYDVDKPGWRWLKQNFGSTFVPGGTGMVDKRKLFSAMQADDTLRLAVNQFMHPLVHEAIETFWNDHECAGNLFAVAEIPLWAETSAQEAAQANIVLVGVACDTSARHERLLQTRGWEQSMSSTMDGWQCTEEKKFRHSDYVLNNNDDVPSLVAQVDKLLTLLQRKASDTPLRKLLQELSKCE